MNVRLVIAFLLLVFMIPAGIAYQSLQATPFQQLFGFAGYIFLAAYLIATGYNQLNKGKPW